MTRQTIVPALRHRDARKAFGLLERGFGARPRVVYDAEDGSVARAEVEGRG